jgi:putative membrane protein insertion efficiency factor
VKRSPDMLRRALLAVFLAPLRFYGRFISPNLGRRCKYHPTCSAYAEQAIRELGIVRGTIVAGWRLLRCNPFSHGGYDPLEARSLFRAKAAADHENKAVA